MTVSLHNNLNYIRVVSFVFISTLYISVYMASSITKKLREREQKLREANELLREKDRIKSEYVLRVTHDIKEDLAAIQTCIEPVTAGITGALNERQRNLLSRASERSRKLIFFIDAFLEITRLKLLQEVKMEKFSLSEVIGEISENISRRAREKSILYKVEVPCGLEMKGVRIHIQEAISNLLANSIKYTPAGGEVILKTEDRQNWILIKIKDTGIGIPQDELPYVFDEFYRTRNARKLEKKGSGLGLSIIKKIVEMHEGKIWVESEEGKGSIFYLELPKKI